MFIELLLSMTIFSKNDIFNKGIQYLSSISSDFIDSENIHLKNNYLFEEHKLPYLFTKQSYLPINNRYSIGNYIYDNITSTINTAIWNNYIDKITHISYRGSYDIEDYIKSDIDILLDKQSDSSRFKESLKLTKSCVKKDYKIEVSGHSLGGSIAIFITNQLGMNDWFLRAITFNPAISPNSVKIVNIFENKIVHLRKFKDIFTITSPPFGKSIIYYDVNDVLKTHSIQNWGTDNRPEYLDKYKYIKNLLIF